MIYDRTTRSFRDMDLQANSFVRYFELREPDLPLIFRFSSACEMWNAPSDTANEFQNELSTFMLGYAISLRNYRIFAIQYT